MRIEGQGPVEPGRVYRPEAGEQRSVPARAGQAAAVDEVTLSREARFRQELLTRLRSLPEVREELIADIRRRLAAGTYTVSDGELAEAIIREIEGRHSS